MGPVLAVLSWWTPSLAFSLFLLYSCSVLVQAVELRCEKGFRSDGVQCVQLTAARADCPNGMAWNCSDSEGSEESCFCESVQITRRIKECPTSTKKVVTQESIETEGIPEAFKCQVSVENASDVICNHGWVLDFHHNKCLAARGFAADCTCPSNYKRNLSHGMCIYETPLSEQSVSRLLRAGRVLQEARSLIAPPPVPVSCICPEGSLTAIQYHIRTADSTMGQEVDDDRRTHPGHNGCFSVEYQERLHKCTKGGIGETVDSDLNPTHENICENTLLVDPVPVCQEGAEEKCTFSEGQGAGRVRNEKNCHCEMKERVRGSLFCDGNATLMGSSCVRKEPGTPYCEMGRLVQTAEGPRCATNS